MAADVAKETQVRVGLPVLHQVHTRQLRQQQGNMLPDQLTKGIFEQGFAGPIALADHAPIVQDQRRRSSSVPWR
jgi:hypothetical protein